MESEYLQRSDKKGENVRDCASPGSLMQRVRNPADRRMRVYLAPQVLVIDEMGYLPLDELGSRALRDEFSEA
jgi:hypothetical protein